MGGHHQAFVVRHKEAQLVVPAKPTPHETKELSDLDDQPDMRFHFAIIMLYRDNPVMKAKDPVEAIREALAQALVWYYPLAGRLVQRPNDRKLTVDCSGQGVLFVEADADYWFDPIHPHASNSKEFLHNVPGSDNILGCPLLLVQVTRLSCGGFVVAARIIHVLCDGLGFAQFLKAVGELAHGASSPSTLPIWKRELFTAKFLNNPSVAYEHPEYDVVSGRKNDSSVDNNVVHQSFFFGPKEIKALRQKLPPHLRSTSKFDLITASIWRSRTRALNFQPHEKIIITCMHNVRDIIAPMASLTGYYGNAVVSSAAVTGAGNLCDNQLGYAVELLEKAKGRVNGDYVKSVINFIDAKGKPPFSRSRNLFVSDTSRLGFHQVDFGWGKPVYAGTFDGGSAVVSAYSRSRNIDGEDGVVVPVFLPAAAMKRFHWELKRLTATETASESLERSKSKKIKSNL